MLIATDLDRTLIYSAAASGAAGGVPPDGTVTVEHLGGRPISFMSAAAAGMLDRLSRVYVVVPVTTRTPAQLARVRLPGAPPRYAVAANGGVLLADGRPDADWAATVRSRVAAVAPLGTAMETLSTVCDPEWAAPPRNGADLFCYAVVDRSAMPAGVLERLHRWADGAGWAVSLQGRKLYLVPTPLTKSGAVAEVARRTGATFMLAAGDSLLDIDLLEAADRGVHPGHGEIADSGWSAPTVDALTATGLRAGEEILRWFAARVADGSTGPALAGRVRRR
ncbi:MAG: hypothetical protein JWO98_4553 [Frankiales bacterium]|nr:hypothetical protein [Frankiales bacterium]